MHDLIDKDGNDPCKDDFERFEKALIPYGVKRENTFRFENDATRRSTTTATKEINKLLRENPDQNYVFIHLYAGHGMIASGKQMVLMNEFNPN